MIYTIKAWCEGEQAARLMIKKAPPYQCLAFDTTGRAGDNFQAMILGFGQIGQHALRQVVMNGQFVGSQFSAIVVDRKAAIGAGHFARRYAGMLRAYDIRFHTLYIPSPSFNALLDQYFSTLKYIVIALGSDRANAAAATGLAQYFAPLDEAQRPIILAHICNTGYAAKIQGFYTPFYDQKEEISGSDIMVRNKRDAMAMAVSWNYSEYVKSAGNVWAAWHKTGYFSRTSCRASADFIPAMLHLAGLDEAAARDQAVFARHVQGERLENLSITEHLRWNAFHFAMGYLPMTLDTVKQRAQSGLSPIQKDAARRRHACLVDWAELDEVSRTISRLENKTIDYKEMDRNNVRAIPCALNLAARAALQK